MKTEVQIAHEEMVRAFDRVLSSTEEVRDKLSKLLDDGNLKGTLKMLQNDLMWRQLLDSN